MEYMTILTVFFQYDLMIIQKWLNLLWRWLHDIGPAVSFIWYCGIMESR